MKLLVFKETDVRLPRRRLQQLFELVVKGEGNPRWRSRVNLVVTDNRAMRRLNYQYRSLDKPTDVLSFNIDAPEDPGGIFGEIYISAPYAVRQAAENGRGAWSEYLNLFCHGLLHLFGHDHSTVGETVQMLKLQAGYLARLQAGK